MRRLSNKRIIIGITGGIAAYKAAELVRTLKFFGSDVRVVMTEGACEFITPLTLQALSGNPVHTNLLDTEAEAGMGHIELARWADSILIAPATANFISQLAVGQGKNLLSAICLASSAPLYLAPAMNQRMWANDATQRNISILKQRGITLFGPEKGLQACGDYGFGRMTEPDYIAKKLADTFDTSLLTGRRVLITAGPTRESVDPVRYISNHSSGKMGFALATAAEEAGADVTLVSGPVNLQTPDRVHRINVESAREMWQHVRDNLRSKYCDIFISCAAVSDYRPANSANCKIKKNPDNSSEMLILELVRNPDILKSVSMLEINRPFTVGFAAETCNLLSHAKNKMKHKQLDMIIANDISNKDIGFGSDNNEVSVLYGDKITVLPLVAKSIIARQLIKLIAIQAQTLSESKGSKSKA